MGLIGAYTLHLYCDHPWASTLTCTHPWPGEYTGNTHRAAKAAAKKAGWKFKRDRVPADDALGNHFDGACFCEKHADDIPPIEEILE